MHSSGIFPKPPFTSKPFTSQDPSLHHLLLSPLTFSTVAHPHIPQAQQRSLCQGQSLKNNTGLVLLQPIKLLMGQLGEFQH